MTVAIKPNPAADRLKNARLPDGAGWSVKSRRAAQKRALSMGLATRFDEYWKYTDPKTLNAAVAPDVDVFEPDVVEAFADVSKLRVIFVDGVFDAALSDELSLAGLQIDRLDQASERDIHWAQDLYGALETSAQTPIQRSLAALNTAQAGQGILIRATGKAALPVSFIYLHTSASSDALFHHVIKLEKGAELTLLENGPVAARMNSVMEIDVADGAIFHHIRAQGRNHQRLAHTHMFARLGAASVFKSFTLTVNGKMTRNETVIDIRGDNSIAHVAGAAVGDGDFHHDDTVFVIHDAVGCESRQVFKKVLRNGARGVFQGKILVKPEAQKTDGYQISQALLLDDDSQFLAKPELEIYADDVACSHGSTSGAIDEVAMFYLRSRGISKDHAQDLLVLAFLAQAIDEIENADIAHDILASLENWLIRHRN